MDKIIKQQFTKAAMMLLMMLLTATTAGALTVGDYTFATGSDSDGEYYVAC